MNILLLLFLLSSKHFICDFPLQTQYQIDMKKYYGNWGGIVHSLIHSVGTFLILVFFISLIPALLFSLLDGTIHYHIDWLKMKLNRLYNLSPTNSKLYWFLFGFDQYLHQLTYLFIVYALIYFNLMIV
jgi:hypothetical protein